MKKLLSLILLSFLVFSACKKDKAREPGLSGSNPIQNPDWPAYNPTEFSFKDHNIHIPGYFPKMKIPNDNPLTEEGVQLGRMLFYDNITSGDNSMSCASCHLPKDGFTDNSKTFSVGINGIKGKRNSMPLFNLGFMDDFFWDGRANSLEEQILMPIADHTELAEDIDNLLNELKSHDEYPLLFWKAFGTEQITQDYLAKAIAQFLRTIISADSKYDKAMRDGWFLTGDELAGRSIFESLTGGDCIHCHSPQDNLFGDFLYRSNALDSVESIYDFKDIGRGEVTGNPKDYGTFKTPSLRNLGLTAPYMHDGRFATLKEVLDHYSEGLQPGPNVNTAELEHFDSIKNGKRGTHLTHTEKSQIIAFLNSLNDTTFFKHPLYQDPFK